MQNHHSFTQLPSAVILNEGLSPKMVTESAQLGTNAATQQRGFRSQQQGRLRDCSALACES